VNLAEGNTDTIYVYASASDYETTQVTEGYWYLNLISIFPNHIALEKQTEQLALSTIRMGFAAIKSVGFAIQHIVEAR